MEHDVVNPTHLETLIAVLRTGSFAGAARQLGYTGSAVSQQIAAFERDTNLTLFERDARGIRATAAAEALGSHANEVFSALSVFDDEIRKLSEGAAGSVRFGSFPSASQQLLPAAVTEFIRKRPDVDLHLEEGEPDNLAPLIISRELDLALAYTYDLAPSKWPVNAKVIPLFSEDLIAFVPPGHELSGSTARISQLAGERWINTQSTSRGAIAFERMCANAGFSPDIRYRSNNYNVVASFVRSGLGVALIPALAAATLEDGDTDTASLSDVTVQRHVVLLKSAANESPALEFLIAAIERASQRLASRTLGIKLDSRLSRKRAN
ncbi:LysR family transcription regulator [Gulosibacter molinativorax]|nr:LysR family transcription regulator [Gulosibacter molinativorax]